MFQFLFFVKLFFPLFQSLCLPRGLVPNAVRICERAFILSKEFPATSRKVSVPDDRIQPPVRAWLRMRERGN